MGEQLAGAAHAALDLVQEEKQAVLVGHFPAADQILGRGRVDAAFALQRLDQNRRGAVGHRRARLVHVAEGDMVEAVHRRAETVQQLVLAGGGDGGQGAAVEAGGAGDDPEALAASRTVLKPARHLQARLDRFGP